MRVCAVLLLALLLGLPGAGWVDAQSSVIARPGRINVFEGDVFLDGQPVKADPRHPVVAQPGSEITTRTGRVEIQIGGDAWLRIAENSAVKMVSDDPTDVRIELLAGSLIVNAHGPVPITTTFDGHTFHTDGATSYRLDSVPAQIRYGKGPVETLEGTVVQRPMEAPDRLFDLWAGERDILTSNKFLSYGANQGGPLLDNSLNTSTGYAPALSAVPPSVADNGQPYHGLDSGILGFGVSPISPLFGSVPMYQVPPAYPIYPGYYYPPGAVPPGVLYPPGAIPTLRVPGLRNPGTVGPLGGLPGRAGRR